MEIEVKQGGIQTAEADTIVVNLFEGGQAPTGATGAVDMALQGALTELIEAGDLTGKAGEVVTVYTRGAISARRVLVVGLGKAEDFDEEAARKAAAAAALKARELKTDILATIVHGAGAGKLGLEQAAQATIEASLLALYEYDAPRKTAEPKHAIRVLQVVEYDPGKLAAIEAGRTIAEAIAAGTSLARDLVNMAPNIATPSRMADAAESVANAYGMKLTVGDRDWAAERNMGAYLAVAQGAGKPPKFIVLEHHAGDSAEPTLVLVGKGITFDSGGLSLKPVENMGAMKSDMGGAAAVLGAMKAVGMLDLPLHVIGIAPCTENMPDANAYRPADVITASNGKTIEIISTDAEGRMILADALVFAGRYQPEAVVDLATLTGACVVALGKDMAAGLFSNDESLAERLLASSQATSERLWRLPLWDDYKKSIQSEVADMKNTGGRMGGVATSAIFLKEFTDYPWAHLDIAGMALTDKANGYKPSGGTGFGVRLLVDFLRNWR